MSKLPSQPTRTYARYLAPVDVWAIAFGCIVGWGAFVMPGTTFLPLAGPLGTVVALAIGTLVMLVIGKNYAYLMEKRPGTGGVYSYAKEAFGRDHAFLCSWFLSLSYLTVVFLNATALLVLSRTVFGNVFRFGFHYNIAGFDIYFGEIALSVAALAVFGLIFIFKKPLLQGIQTVSALVLLLGVFVLTVVALPHMDWAQLPTFHPDSPSSVPGSVITIVLLAPWAFVGFDTASLETAHFKFSMKKSWRIIAASIICGGLVYIALTVISITYTPEGVGSWQEYVSTLDNYSGTSSVPTFFAAESSLGTAGVVIVGVTALAAIFTGIIAAYRASMRVLSTMAEDHIVPQRFLNSTVCILFVMILSIAFSFFGRNALNWFVDLTSFGAIIGFGYTSASAWKLAKNEGNRKIVVTGFAGTLISAAFCIAHLLSRVGSVETMGTQSFIFLSLWCLLGFVFYWRTIRKSDLSDFKGVVTSSTALLCVLIFTALMWFIKSVLEAADQGNLHGVIIQKGIALAVMVMLGVAVMLYTQDTLRKRHNQLERDKIHAEESSKAKSQFLFNISHDIRTPMNAILGYTHLARQEPDIPENVKDYIEKIDVSGKHLLTLINDILDMSLIESGKLELRNDKANIVETVTTAYDMFKVQMEEKKINYALDISGISHPCAVFDSNRLLRVILNLLSNANKFTPDGGSVYVGLTEGEADSENRAVYSLTVRDSGIGMNKEFTETIFEAFARERTATVSKTQGTGLGMSITKNIVDAMGGTIQLKTAPGQGTEFVIGLHFAPCEEELQDMQKEQAKTVIDFSGKRVLLAEDMAINRQIATKLLSRLGVEVEAAENGQAAVDKLTSHPAGTYDAILMDIQMPVMDGFEATAAIRALDDPALSAVPIIAVTANASDDDAKKARESGMNSHIAKPIDPSELSDTLAAILLDSEKNT